MNLDGLNDDPPAQQDNELLDECTLSSLGVVNQDSWLGKNSMSKRTLPSSLVHFFRAAMSENTSWIVGLRSICWI